MDAFVWGASLSLFCCVAFNVYLFWSCKQDESYTEHPLDRILLIRKRCHYHRKCLLAYHDELCEHWAVHPRSEEGDMLYEVVFNDANYDEVAARIR